MASKRKFQVNVASDEEEEPQNIGGVNLFKKMREENNSEPISSRKETEVEKKNDEATVSDAVATSISEETGSKQKHVGAATNPVGNHFRDTFAYLKKSNLFVLPPMPQPKEKTLPKSSNSIIVNSRQRGNPILKHIRNIPWEYGEIVPDYEIGQTSCALFLSMRYHSLNPDYIHDRLKKLGNMYDLRVLLVQVDAVNCKPSLKELGRIAMYSNCTMILAWTPEEAGRYLETYKSYENKPPDILQQRVESDHLSKVQDLLTTIKSVNKTDVITLLSTFGSLRSIVNASKQEIGDCPGIGSQKATRLYQAFNDPFKRAHSKNSVEELTDEQKTKNTTKTIPSYSTELPADCPLKRPEEEPKHRADKKNEKEPSTKKNKQPPKSRNQDTEKPTSSSRSRKTQNEEVLLVNDDDDGDSNPTYIIGKAAKNDKNEEINILNRDDDDIAATMSKSDAIHSFLKNKALNMNPTKAVKEMNVKKKNGNASSVTSKKKIKIPSRKVPLQEENQQTQLVERRLRRPEPYNAPATVSAVNTDQSPSLRKPLVNTGKDKVSDITDDNTVSDVQQKITEKEYNDLIAADDDDDSDSCSSLIEY